METVLPEGFLLRMRRLLGAEYPRFYDSLQTPPRRGLRVNTGKIAAPEFISLFSRTLTPAPFAPQGYYLNQPFAAGADPLHHAGAYYMQEPSAMSAVTVLNPQPGERVLDMCAAPGGKSTQIAAALQRQGLLWCNEVVRPRADMLLQNLERCGVRNAVVSGAAPEKLALGLPGFFDAVLTDAPCSGEGMFYKEPAAAADWSESAVRRCAARQLSILAAAAQTVRPGGRLVYSTCTFAPEENECVAAAFLAAHPDFEPLPITVSFGRPGFDFAQVAPFAPAGLTAGRYDSAACRRIFPFDGGAGHFVAAFHRVGDALPAAPGFDYPALNGDADAAKALYEDCFTDGGYGVLSSVGGLVRLLPEELPRLSGLSVLCAGVALAQPRKNRLEPCHAAFMAADAGDCRRTLSLPPDDPRLTAFLRGEELAVSGDPGYTAVAAGGVTVGFGKLSGGRLKNRYPKGLRLRAGCAAGIGTVS